MKRKIFYILTLALAASITVSCSKDDDNFWADAVNATVTFRPQANGSYILKQDDSTALIVSNPSMKDYPFADKLEKRALIQYKKDSQVEQREDPAFPGVKYWMNVTLYSMEPMMTKEPVLFDSSKNLGEDPIGLYLDANMFPTTLIEDGYLMLCFNLPIRFDGLKHEINLVYGSNPDDPYELVVKHDAHGQTYGGESRAFVMNFPLKNLPDTKGETVKLTLKWYSAVTHNIASTTFKYKSRTDW